ncbi:hypothetical protein [Chryseobacterium contaminans]|uniref:hypothetical protein n=1 Tax=Chryseobacterium contaminans TaxID=1423959 RepID=UPI003019EBDE
MEKIKGIGTQPFINCLLNAYNIYTNILKKYAHIPPEEGFLLTIFFKIKNLTENQ